MNDREKVVEALEMSYKYSNVDENNTLVPQCIVLHALALLKAQEPTTVEPKCIELADETKLKPCPICGAKAFISHTSVDGFDFGWSVGCPRFCLADGIHGFDYDTPEDEVEKHKPIGHCYTSKERAIEAWNDRVDAGEWRIGPWQRMT